MTSHKDFEKQTLISYMWLKLVEIGILVVLLIIQPDDK